MPSLEDLNATAYNYQDIISAQFQQICQPVYDLGIKYFTYIKVFKDGSYLNLINNKEYITHYMKNIDSCGQVDVINLNAVCLNGNYTYITAPAVNNYDKSSDPILHLLHGNDIWHLLHFYGKDEGESVTIHAFAMACADIYARELYTAYLPYLKHFINYFNEKAAALICCKDKQRLAHFNQQFDFSSPQFNEPSSQKIENFLKATPLKHLTIKSNAGHVTLSKREIECLTLFADGKNTKEVALKLNLSPKTVEYYLSRMKIKTGYQSKTKLITRFHESI